MEHGIEKINNVHEVTKKTALWSLSTGTYLFVDYFFDFFLYYIAIRQFGPFVGGGSVLLLGICIDLYILYLYDKSEKDIFGFEEIKKLRDYEGENKWRIFVSTTLKRGNILAMLLLATYSNPCLTTIYMRPSNQKRRRINSRDFLVFLTSFFVDIIWIVVVYGFVEIESLIRAFIPTIS